MQRIKLLDGTFVENVQEINDYMERVNQDNRKVLNITVLNTNYDDVYNKFSNQNNLTNIEIQGLTDVVIGTNEETGEPIIEQQYVTQGLQTNYTILNFIKGNVASGSYTVQLHQKSDMEQELLETQLALAELTNLIIEGGLV